MIELLWSIFDVSLVLLVLALAWASCSTQDMMRAVTLFIALGLILAIIWARLKAPDLALAEAVIGAGISGALLLSAIKDYPSTTTVLSRQSSLVEWVINGMTLGLVIIMTWAVWHGLNMSDGLRLSEQVMSQVPVSGVSNPVTAVLLNFRAYDTLLELAVVLTAVLTVLNLNHKRADVAAASPLLRGMTRWLVPLLVVTAGYLLWVGAHAPGGAFQAGAMLASAMILLQLSNPSSLQGFNLTVLRILLVIGIFIFVLVGIWMMSVNDDFLAFNPAWAGSLILIIEFAATLSIATALTLAYLGGRPTGWEFTNPVHSTKQHNGEPS